MASPRLLLVDNHDSYSYNLVHLIASVVGREPDVVTVDRLTSTQAAAYDAVVISPGPGHPATEPDFAACLEIIRGGQVPVLGVCLGHQGIAVAFGGTVERRPPAHGVVSAVHHRGDGLYTGLPSPFRAVRYHSLCVTEVPPELVVDAWTGDGTVMGLRHATLPVFGVQFHPESILSEDGARLVRRFLALSGLTVPDRSPAPAPPPTPEPAPAPAATARPGPAGPVVRAWPAWREPADLAWPLLAAEPRAFWLDSARRTPWSGRWSYLGWLRPDEPAITASVRAGDPSVFDTLGGLVPVGAPAGHPSGVPFTGGWVGWFGYACGDLPARPAPDGVPDACLLRASRFLAFDHERRVVHLVAPDDTAADAFAAEIEARLADPARARRPEPPVPPVPPVRAPVVDRPDRASYRAEYARVQEELHAGNTYEATLAHTVRVTAAVEPLALYLRLRELNPAPYAAYLRHGDVKVLSSSPERFLSAGPDDVLETRPIKGTTPRGETVQDDALHRWRLGHDPKFLAENLMIADLLRNDLSRVCRPGSVQVSELMTVESYASVHQLVTTVQGRRRPGTGVVDCIRALFPGGSMTGAPKLRTMEIIDRVESEPRGIFSGALGWVGQDGGCDLSIVIRTLVGTGPVEDGAWSIGVGGGIVVASRPDEEYDETEWKASRLLAAVAQECTGPGRAAGGAARG